MLKTDFDKIDYPYNLILNKRRILTAADTNFISILEDHVCRCQSAEEISKEIS